jgi:GNAT superfamily N-acetyltransferase
MKQLHYKLHNYIEREYFISSGMQKIFQFNIYRGKDKIGKFEISIDLFITFEDFYIEPKYRGNGYGSDIIKSINNLIDKMAIDFKVTDLFLTPHSYDKSELSNEDLKSFYIKYFKVIDISADEYEINLFKACFV